MSYTTLVDLGANTTLTAGTYYLEANVNLNSYTLTFDCVAGPIIIKRNGDVYFVNVGVVNTINSSAVNKVYWTVKDDDTVGEIIDGSTGSPSASGGSFNNAVAITVTGTWKYWELRWINDKQFLNVTGSNTKYFQYIDFKNCYFNSVNVIYLNDVKASFYFEYINCDSSNSFIGTSSLIYCYAKYKFNDIYIYEGSSTSALINLNCSTSTISNLIKNIRIRNTSGYGFWVEVFWGSPGVIFENCCMNIINNGTNAGKSVTINLKNCLFDTNINDTTTYALNRGDSGDVVYIIQNCIFKGFTKVFYNRESGVNNETYLTINNCIFINNTQLLNNAPISGHLDADFNAYYNNGETYWTRGANDFTADPEFRTKPYGVIIDSTFAKYIPDGYFVGNLAAFEQKGSDTFNNLSINEDENTATGKWYLNGKTQKVTPGINYLVDSFITEVITPKEIEIEINIENDTLVLLPNEEGYKAISLSMVGKKNNLAILKSGISGEEIIIDVSDLGELTLEHCAFKDVNFSNQVEVLNGEDLGNNTNIIFSTAPEDLIVNVTSSNYQEILLDEFPYNVTSFSMIGEINNLASLRSAVQGSPVILDLTTVGNQTLNFCSFRDIEVINGTITVTDGYDLGGNEGITFNSTVIPSDLTIDVVPKQTMLVYPKFEPYNVISFSMIGEKYKLATLKSSVTEYPLIIDISNIGNLELEYVSFENVTVVGGTISVLNGKDLGGNTGITFSVTEPTNQINILVAAGDTVYLDPLGDAYDVQSFLMTGEDQNFASLRSSIPGVKVYLDMKIIPEQSLQYCQFEDIVVYNSSINVLNGNDLGGNVNIYFSPKTNFECFLNKQVARISSLILTMRKENGYNFDWQITQNRNLAIGKFPRAEVYITNEINVDEDNGLGSHSYTNEVDVEIKINAKFESPSKNVIFDYFNLEHLMVDDLKRLFGKEVNLTLDGTCNSFMYKGFSREIESNDEYTPKNLITKWKLKYTQDRNYPNLSA